MRVEPSEDAPLLTRRLVHASAEGATSPAETARAGRNFEKGWIMRGWYQGRSGMHPLPDARRRSPGPGAGTRGAPMPRLAPTIPRDSQVEMEKARDERVPVPGDAAARQGRNALPAAHEGGRVHPGGGRQDVPPGGARGPVAPDARGHEGHLAPAQARPPDPARPHPQGSRGLGE